MQKYHGLYYNLAKMLFLAVIALIYHMITTYCTCILKCTSMYGSMNGPVWECFPQRTRDAEDNDHRSNLMIITSLSPTRTRAKSYQRSSA